MDIFYLSTKTSVFKLFAESLWRLEFIRTREKKNFNEKLAKFKQTPPNSVYI